MNRSYVQKDLLEIAKGQLALENRLARSGSKFLFCDTNLIVIKIWSDFKYGSTDSWIEEQLAERSYDFYLLTDIDLPWEEDPMREHPQKREELFQLYKKYLEDHELPFAIVSGNGQQRLEKAIDAIKI